MKIVQFFSNVINKFHEIYMKKLNRKRDAEMQVCERWRKKRSSVLRVAELRNGIPRKKLIYTYTKDTGHYSWEDKSWRGIYVGEARKAFSRPNYYEEKTSGKKAVPMGNGVRDERKKRKRKKRRLSYMVNDEGGGLISLGAFPCQTLPVFLSTSI